MCIHLCVWVRHYSLMCGCVVVMCVCLCVRSRVCLYPFLLPPLAVGRVQAVHEAGHALLQRVQRVVEGVVTREVVPQAAQGFPDQL